MKGVSLGSMITGSFGDVSVKIQQMSAPFNDPKSFPSSGSPVLFYDGVCNLCNRSVRWVIRRDRLKVFRFASLQSSSAARMLPPGLAGSGVPATVILLDGTEVLTKSDVWLRTVRRLGAPWSWLAVLGIFPRALRNGVYDFIAARRYRWFGKLDQCPLPDPKLRDRFLD
jgi:predicted DCC family thiol-disulfide oxidoreductase YuxK